MKSSPLQREFHCCHCAHTCNRKPATPHAPLASLPLCIDVLEVPSAIPLVQAGSSSEWAQGSPSKALKCKRCISIQMRRIVHTEHCRKIHSETPEPPARWATCVPLELPCARGTPIAHRICMHMKLLLAMYRIYAVHEPVPALVYKLSVI